MDKNGTNNIKKNNYIAVCEIIIRQGHNWSLLVPLVSNCSSLTDFMVFHDIFIAQKLIKVDAAIVICNGLSERDPFN